VGQKCDTLLNYVIVMPTIMRTMTAVNENDTQLNKIC